MEQKRSNQQTQKTNDSSIVSKYSASSHQYIKDDFLKYFIRKMRGRSPLIHRGYYVRMKAIDLAVSTFIYEVASTRSAQIVSLGAGFDTIYFRHKDVISAIGLNVFEIDFYSVISQKYKLILESPELLSCLSSCKEIAIKEIFAFKNYFMVGCDLTALDNLETLLSACEISYKVPTLFISECALTYVNPKSVDKLIKWMASLFQNCLFCCYEQILPDDGFGLIMKQHFESLGSPLRNVDLYPSKSTQVQRMLSLGFSCCVVCNMNELYHSLPAVERKRVNTLEPFDEFEDFCLKCSHYTLTCASQGSCQNMLPLPQAQSECSSVTTGEVELHNLHLSEDSSPIQRYGHSSVCLPSGEVVIVGGFGISQSCNAHKRLNDVLLFKKDAEKWICKTLINCGDAPMGIVHHKVVLLKDGKIIVTGGRSSPTHPQQELLTITLEGFSISHWRATGMKPSPRWRHSATPIIHQGEECVLMVGGCTSDCAVLHDVILIKISNWTCLKLPLTFEHGVHSHSAVSCEDGVVIAGGLNDDMVPLETCHLITYKSTGWSLAQIMLSCPFPLRFSCGSCMCEEKLLLLGGVGEMENLELLVFDLKTKDINLLFIKSLENVPVLLQSFTVHSVGGGTLWLFGGGGNCFSFGSHFNKLPMQINIFKL